jgi:hypothetical protein
MSDHETLESTPPDHLDATNSLDLDRVTGGTARVASNSDGMMQMMMMQMQMQEATQQATSQNNNSTMLPMMMMMMGGMGRGY